MLLLEGPGEAVNRDRQAPGMKNGQLALQLPASFARGTALAACEEHYPQKGKDESIPGTSAVHSSLRIRWVIFHNNRDQIRCSIPVSTVA